MLPIKQLLIRILFIKEVLLSSFLLGCITTPPKLFWNIQFSNTIFSTWQFLVQGSILKPQPGAVWWIEEVFKNNTQSVEDYKNGKTKAMGYLVGQTMKAMKGKAAPDKINKLIKEKLDALCR